jgi:hypothetical protein
MTLGDWLVLIGLVVTGLIYWRQTFASRRRDVISTLDTLEAVRSGMVAWGDFYFANGYDATSAQKRAQQDFDLVMGGAYAQVFLVPTEPLTALIEHPQLIRKETIEAANVALWQMGVFNQLVQVQADFIAQHVAEIRDAKLPRPRREALARGARGSLLTACSRHFDGGHRFFSTSSLAIAISEGVFP